MKTWKILVVLIITTTLVFTACPPDGDGNGTTTHTHDWEWTSNVIAATCTTASKDTAICKFENCTATNERTGTVAALGHDMGEWVIITNPTEIANGEQESTCKRIICNNFVETRYILATSYFEIIGSTDYRIIRSNVEPPNVVYIPSEYNGLPVTEIGSPSDWGSGAFSGMTNIIEVYIPDTITTIYPYAFSGCTNITSIIAPAVSSVGFNAFSRCTNLNSVNFPANAVIGNGVFTYCTSLTNFILTGTGVLSVIEGGKALVRNNTELVAYPSASGDIVINTITSLTWGAFYGAANLVSAIFPVLIDTGMYSFSYCSNLESVSFPITTTLAQDTLSWCPKLMSVNIPSVTNIGSLIFRYNGSTPLLITMGNVAPSTSDPWGGTITAQKPVTIRIPTGATGYGFSPTDATTQNWGNAFRGMGWNRNTGVYGTGNVNETINLTIEYVN